MGNKQRGKMKKRLLVAALAACMAFPASLPAQAAGTVHGKKVGWIQEKGQTYYCDPSTLQNVRGKWQLIGKNYYYFDPEMEAFEQLVSTLQLAMKISKKLPDRSCE